MNEFAMKRSYGPTPNYPLSVAYRRPSNEFISIGGPCSLESEEQINIIAKHVATNGGTHLRAGVFRAGTYPGKVFGLQDHLLRPYRDAAIKYGLKNIIEVLDYTDRSLTMLSDYCDCFQVGARSQQNYSLLRKLGALGKPIFLKRNPGSKIDELIGSCEHILTGQSESDVESEVYLVERGSSTFEDHSRWTLSVSMIAALKQIIRVPVIVDGSHSSGRRDLVGAMTLAGIAAGADGCLIEVHPNPELSISDSDQAVDFNEYESIMKRVFKIREVLS